MWSAIFYTFNINSLKTCNKILDLGYMVLVYPFSSASFCTNFFLVFDEKKVVLFFALLSINCSRMWDILQ
jgi:hypothetical protein